MRIKLLVIVLILGSFGAGAQTGYPVSSIPKNLLSKAGAVVRNFDTELRINSLSDGVLKEKYAITILNESGQEHADMVFYYDKTTQIKSLKATVYNEFGLPVFRISEKNFADRSAVSDGSLYQDDRVKRFNPSVKNYPYTLEYEIEYKIRQTLLLPSWYPVKADEIAVEKSTLKVVYPADFNLRHKEYSFKGEMTEGTEGSSKVLSYSLANFPAIRNEPYSPNYERYVPIVKLAPEKFSYKDIKGSFSNWQEYGKWMSERMLSGRDEVSPQTKEAILNLVKDVNQPKEKARLIYEYMQNKMRYISVQIGIGGFQPIPAAEVDRLGYGDCKGLVNYTKSLLNIAGIDSYYCIVYGGTFKKDIDPGFTSLNQGNHIILCLPFERDTTWLECTSKYLPFGFLGSFTDDRIVLACTPEGGKLMRTPKFSAEESRQTRVSHFDVSEDGSVSGKIVTQFGGSQYDNHDYLFNEPTEEQLKKVTELYPKLSFAASSIEFKKIKEAKPRTVESISVTSKNYCSLNDKKLHLPLNKLNTFKTAPKEIRNRQTEVYINSTWLDEDLTTFNLPAGYTMLAPTQKKTVEKPFGTYTYEIQYAGNKIIYKRTMHMKDGYYKPELYEELVDFYQQIMELDGMTVVLSK